MNKEQQDFIWKSLPGHIMETHCIVEKEMVKDYYSIYKEEYLRNPKFRDRMEYHKGAMQAMEHLFGEEVK